MDIDSVVDQEILILDQSYQNIEQLIDALHVKYLFAASQLSALQEILDQAKMHAKNHEYAQANELLLDVIDTFTQINRKVLAMYSTAFKQEKDFHDQNRQS